MKVIKEKTEDHQVFLTIEMAPEEIEEASQATYRRLVQRINVPGFRKGKAPRPLLVRHIGGKAFLTDVIENAVPEAYEKALTEQDLEPVARPQIELVERDPLIFKAVVPLRPVVHLGDYRKTRLKPAKIDVTEERVDAVVEELRQQWAIWEPVERAAAFSDLVSMDIESTIDGEPFINQQGAQFQVTGGSSAPAPGFAEEIVGMKASEEKEFTLPFTDNDTRSEVAGKEATFKVTVTAVKEEKLPDVTDEFAAQVDADLKTVGEMRGRIREDLTKRAEDRSQVDFEEKVIDATVEVSKVDYPPVLVESEIHRMLDDQVERLQMQDLTLEQFLQGTGKTEAEFHEELHPVAEKRLVRGLVLGKVAEDEEILITATDIDAEIEEMLKDTADERKAELRSALNTLHTRESVRQRLLSRRTIGKLTGIALGDTVDGGAAPGKDEPRKAKPKDSKSSKTKPKNAQPKESKPNDTETTQEE